MRTERLHVRSSLRKLWTHLPYDGCGLRRPADPDLAALRRSAESRFWRTIPGLSRPVLVAASRLAWTLAAAVRVHRFGRATQLPRAERFRLLLDCVAAGADPGEALAWRRCVAPEPHPLPHRSASRVLPHLGSADDHRLLADKLAASEHLARAGLPVPPLLTVLAPAVPVDPAAEPWCTPAALFVKPRFGSGSRGAVSVDVVEPGLYSVGHGRLTNAAGLRRQLPAGDELLVQRRLPVTPQLSDLAPAGRAPVLRLTTARRRGEAPFLHSSLLCIEVPGESPRNFLRGQLRVPIDPRIGVMSGGIWAADAGQRYDRLPWNGAILDGRTLPGFGPSVDIALRAMSAVPGLPLVNWDLIVSPNGPVILEGNTGGNWVLTNLAAVCGLPSMPLAPLLRSWAEEA